MLLSISLLALSCGKKSTKEENRPPVINELKPSRWAVDFQTDLVITAQTSDQDIEISLVQPGGPTGEFLKLPPGIRLSGPHFLTRSSLTLILRISDEKGEKIETAFR